MSWDDTKTDGSSTLPAAEYNTMVSVIKNQDDATVKIYKDGANYIARNGATGAIISSNTNFSTVCQAAGDSITGNGTIFIKDPGSNIVIPSTITFTNKEIYVTSDMAKLDFTALNDVVFLFQDTVGASILTCGISNFRLTGEDTSTSQIFVKFSNVIAYVNNLINSGNDHVYCVVQIYGASYLSRISNVWTKAALPIEILGYVSGTIYDASGTVIDNCNLGYLSGDNAIKITYGYGITVSNCWLEATKTGILAVGADELKVMNNYFATSVMGIDSTGLFILCSNNYFENQAASGGALKLYSSYGGTVTGNIFYSNTKNNWVGITLSTVSDLTITGNVFFEEGTPTGTFGISSAGTSKEMAISGNAFIGSSAMTSTAIYALRSDNSTIVGNTIVNFSTGVTIATNMGCIIEHNVGHKTENWGTSTGTGAQQTIAHGLADTPSLVLLSDKELDAKPYQSAAKDATNIYITAAVNQDYSWYVKV